jgi:hypothetical protein
MKDKNVERLILKQLGKKTKVFGIFLIVLSILVVLILLIIRNSAVQNSIRISASIPLPPQADIIYSSNGFIYNSIGCYHSYSVIFIGSNLEVSEIIQTHRQYFTSKGWYMNPSENGEVYWGDQLMNINETDILVHGDGEIEGYNIDVLLCDYVTDCAYVDPNYDDREEIDYFGNIYRTTYWIAVRYKPSSVRYNLCDCCSGG